MPVGNLCEAFVRGLGVCGIATKANTSLARPSCLRPGPVGHQTRSFFPDFLPSTFVLEGAAATGGGIPFVECMPMRANAQPR